MDTVKKIADQILQEVDLVSTLEKLGDVHMVGSYALDLMHARDIDIHIVSEEYSPRKVMKVMHPYIESQDHIYQHFMSQKKGYEKYSNFMDMIPQGMYVGLLVLWEGQPWKIDIWYYTPGEDPVKTIESTQEYQQLLSQQLGARETILGLKEKVFHLETQSYQAGFSGKVLYDGVLKKGYTQIEDF